MRTTKQAPAIVVPRNSGKAPVNLEFLHCKGTARKGKPARGTVLFVHGAYCGAWIWSDTFLPYFCQAGWDCYAVSLRGHGGSEGSLTWSTLSDYVDDIEAAMERIGGPAILIGHSMGGLV